MRRRAVGDINEGDKNLQEIGSDGQVVFYKQLLLDNFERPTCSPASLRES